MLILVALEMRFNVTNCAVFILKLSDGAKTLSAELAGHQNQPRIRIPATAGSMTSKTERMVWGLTLDECRFLCKPKCEKKISNKIQKS